MHAAIRTRCPSRDTHGMEALEDFMVGTTVESRLTIPPQAHQSVWRRSHGRAIGCGLEVWAVLDWARMDIELARLMPNWSPPHGACPNLAMVRKVGSSRVGDSSSSSESSSRSSSERGSIESLFEGQGALNLAYPEVLQSGHEGDSVAPAIEKKSTVPAVSVGSEDSDRETLSTLYMHDLKISPNYYRDALTWKFDPKDSPITPEWC
ncbi:hypothetical protein LWI29_016612 [Acer saccharum]|uniref:Uncharacterized protein n=1 Tax=Acer saccharum TaxID=4024 RepID=A0AA39T7Y7_ACESA|nr:hypothetical protein LWI29_016612 [Acer saccharum]